MYRLELALQPKAMTTKAIDPPFTRLIATLSDILADTRFIQSPFQIHYPSGIPNLLLLDSNARVQK